MPHSSAHLAGSDPLEGEDFSEEFFSSDSLAPVEAEWEPQPAAMAPASRRAMYATLGLIAASWVGIGGFVFYARVLVPTPVVVGTAVAQPPVSFAYEATESREVVAPAPVAPVAPTVAVVEEGPLQAAAPDAAAPVAAAEVPAPAAAPATAPTTRPKARRSARSKPVRAAYATLNRGDFAVAERLAQRAVAERPHEAHAWIVLGAARDALGDRQGAKTAYRLCVGRADGPGLSHCRALARR